MFDTLIPKGLQWYWRGDFFDTVSDGPDNLFHANQNIPPVPV